MKHGVNLNCGSVYPFLIQAVEEGLITEQEIDEKLKVLLRTRFKLGMFDPLESNPYNSIPIDVVNSPQHRRLAREAAVKSAVLLKNDGVLPLRNDLPLYFVTGPNAANIGALLGNYYGINDNIVTILEGLAAGIQPGSQMQYQQGVRLDRPNANPIDWSSGTAKQANATFYVMGITGLLEGEEGESIGSANFGDRIDYNIPQNQIDYLRNLKKDNPNPVIAIITGGSPMNLAEVHELADAALLVWYPGEEGGNAVADIVFGKAAPSGKLPVTFPKSLDQLPPYEDYSMEGRTYRYMKEEPLYPFGFGLSFVKFDYSGISLSADKIRRNQPIEATVTVTNNGKMKAEEVAQLYLTDKKASARTPLFSLAGVQRLTLEPGESKQVKFTIDPEQMKLVTETGDRVLEPGEFIVYISGSLPGKRSEELGASRAAEASFTLR